MRIFLTVLGVLLGLSVASAQVNDRASNSASPDNFSVAAVGDIIYLRPSLKILEATAPSLLRVLRDADVTFGNFESNVFALDSFTGAPQDKTEGPLLLSTLAVPRELQAMGFDVFSHANNHSFDFGADGIRATNRTLSNTGVVYAGSGQSLTEARKPQYFTTRGVRVALIAATSSFTEPSVAADGWGKVRSRPGINPLRVQSKILMSPRDFDALKGVSLNASMPGVLSESSDELRMFNQTFKRDPAIQNRVDYTYRMNDQDRKDLLAAVAEARKQSSIVIFSLHTHQATRDSTRSPDFVVTLAREAIDAGADMFVAHGPHQLRGVEIYKGKPIFHSLANFSIMQPSPDVNPTPLVIPPGSIFTQRAFFESAIAVGRYRDGKLAAIELHPFELAATDQFDTHGLPQPVSAEAGRAIVMRLQALSKPFGAEIAFEKGIGVIHLTSKSGG